VSKVVFVYVGWVGFYFGGGGVATRVGGLVKLEDGWVVGGG